MQLLFDRVDCVDEVFELSCHKIGVKTKLSWYRKLTSWRSHFGNLWLSIDFSCIKNEGLRRIATKYEHVSLADLDTRTRLSVDEILVADIDFRPTLVCNWAAIFAISLLIRGKRSRISGVQNRYLEWCSSVAKLHLVVIRARHQIDYPLIHQDSTRVRTSLWQILSLEPKICECIVAFATLE